MIFRPAQLGMAKLDRLELEQDKKACRKIGPCGVGKKALVFGGVCVVLYNLLMAFAPNLFFICVAMRCV